MGLVGETAKGRKGVSWGPVRELMQEVDPGWAENRVVSGLSSGEGLIYAVRDEVADQEGRGGRHGPRRTGQAALVVEGELASVLKVMGREGNTLSPTIARLGTATG